MIECCCKKVKFIEGEIMHCGVCTFFFDSITGLKTRHLGILEQQVRS